MKFTTLLPLADNDGNSNVSKVNAIIQSLSIQFGGCSKEGIVDGVWIDGGAQFRDQSVRVTVVCDNALLEDARQRVIEIGRELGQLTMYFEVRDYEGIQFLRIDETHKSP